LELKFGSKFPNIGIDARLKRAWGVRLKEKALSTIDLSAC